MAQGTRILATLNLTWRLYAEDRRKGPREHAACTRRFWWWMMSRRSYACCVPRLESSGYRVIVAQHGLEALEKLRTDPPAMIITDLAMPEMDGVELTRAVRQQSQTPILVLSVQNQDASKVRALDEGADDYVTKPFSIQELLARVRAHLRRSATEEEAPEPLLRVGDFAIDREAHRVSREGEDIHLTPKEFDLLLYFARSPGRVHTHKSLLRAVWGPAGDDQPEYLRVLVAQVAAQD